MCVPDLRGNAFSFSLLNMMLSVGLSYGLYYVPSMPTFGRVFMLPSNELRAFQVVQWDRIHLPVQEMQEAQVWPLGWEDALE